MNSQILGKAVVGIAVLATVGACSIPNTQADEIYVHKGGGPIEGHDPKGCVPQATREVNSAFDDYYAYPANQRVFDFTGGKDSDRGPIEVVSSDGQTLTVPGTLSFNLNINCDVLQAFHDNVGNRYTAYMENDQTGDGWTKVLNLYMYPSLNSTLDRVAKRYTWKQLYSDLSIKDEMNREVNSTIAELIDQQLNVPDAVDKKTKSHQTYFQAFSALIQQPVADKDLVASIKGTELAKAQALQAQAKAQADATTTKLKAEADAKAAQAAAAAQVAQKTAELKVARLEAAINKATIDSYGGPEKYNDYLAIQKGLNPFQPSYNGQTLISPQP